MESSNGFSFDSPPEGPTSTDDASGLNDASIVNPTAVVNAVALNPNFAAAEVAADVASNSADAENDAKERNLENVAPANVVGFAASSAETNEASVAAANPTLVAGAGATPSAAANAAANEALGADAPLAVTSTTVQPLPAHTGQVTLPLQVKLQL